MHRRTGRRPDRRRGRRGRRCPGAPRGSGGAAPQGHPRQPRDAVHLVGSHATLSSVAVLWVERPWYRGSRQSSVSHMAVARACPEVDAGVDGVLVDGGELVGAELQVVQGAEVLLELADAAGADQDVVTRGSRSAQASASWARLWPRLLRDLVQRADVAERLSVSRSVDSDLSWLAREPSGMPSRYLPVSMPWASGEKRDAAGADLLEGVEQALGLDPAVEHRVRGLVDQQRRPEVGEDRGRPRGVLRRSRRRCRRRAPCPPGRRCRSAPIVSSSGVVGSGRCE